MPAQDALPRAVAEPKLEEASTPQSTSAVSCFSRRSKNRRSCSPEAVIRMTPLASMNTVLGTCFTFKGPRTSPSAMAMGIVTPKSFAPRFTRSGSGSSESAMKRTPRGSQVLLRASSSGNSRAQECHLGTQRTSTVGAPTSTDASSGLPSDTIVDWKCCGTLSLGRS